MAPSKRSGGLCVVCQKPKQRERKKVKAPAGGKDYSRMPKTLWQVELERDPYCSRTCLERDLGIEQTV